MDAKIEKNHFMYNGAKYFRKASESINLGSYGNKVKSVFVANGLVHDDFVKGKFPIKAVTSISLKEVDSSSSAFELAGSFFTAKVNGKGNVKVKWTNDEIRDLSLIKIDVTSEQDLRKCTNTDKNCFNQLKDHNNGTICDQIFVIVKSSLIQNASFGADTTATVNILGGIFSIDLKGKTENSSSLSLEVSAGSVFAYALRKPDFDTVWKKNAKKIEQLKRDEWGLA